MAVADRPNGAVFSRILPWGTDQEYNEGVRRELPQPLPRPEQRIERRYAGWAIMVGVLGVGLMLMGVMLIALLQAPFEQSRAVVTGFVLLALGGALLPVAWFGRRIRERD